MQVSTILKVQRPVSPGATECLIYNEDRSLQVVTELPKRTFRKLFAGGRFRAYILGRWDGINGLAIDEILPDQEF